MRSATAEIHQPLDEELPFLLRDRLERSAGGWAQAATSRVRRDLDIEDVGHQAELDAFFLAGLRDLVDVRDHRARDGQDDLVDHVSLQDGADVADRPQHGGFEDSVADLVGSGSRWPTMRMPHSECWRRVSASRRARVPLPTIRTRRKHSPCLSDLWKYQTTPRRMATRARKSRTAKITMTARLTYWIFMTNRIVNKAARPAITAWATAQVYARREVVRGLR